MASIKDIIVATAKITGVAVSDIKKKGKSVDGIGRAKRIVVAVSRLCLFRYDEIAAYLNLNNASVMRYDKSVDDLCDKSPKFHNQIKEVIKKIGFQGWKHQLESLK